MRAYIIRRLLLMVPTLLGVTIVCFLILKMAPGDPLKNQLSQMGSQGESSTTREAFLLQKRQWKLDKPLFLNFRWFRNYESDARMCAHFAAMSEDDLLSTLTRLSGGEGATFPGFTGADELAFLRGLGIESFNARLADAEQRPEFARVVRTAVQLRTEDLSDYGAKYFSEILSTSKDPRLLYGAIRCLSAAMLSDPFSYTYSKDPDPGETEGVVSTWTIWWNREMAKFPPHSPERHAAVQSLFGKLVAEPSRGKILEGVKGFAKNDAPFLMDVLLRETPIKEKYVASIALRSWIGRPLRVDLKATDPPAQAEAVAQNWLAYLSTHALRYRPSLPRRVWLLVADTQYANSLIKLVTFSFGKSMLKPYDPVGPKIWNAFIVSVWLMLAAEVIIYLFAVPIGVYIAVRRGRWQDRGISLLLFLFHSMPSVVAGMLFLTLFCYGDFLKIFPMFGLHTEGSEAFPPLKRFLDYLWHIALPVTVYVLGQLAYLAIYSRSSLLDVVHQDYIRTARAKGLGEMTVIFKHALRNALIPVITLFSSFIPALLGGSVIVEVLFGIPGMGRLSFESIDAKDYNTIMAIIYIDAIVVMFSILLSDLLYVLVDPRISFSRAEGAA